MIISPGRRHLLHLGLQIPTIFPRTLYNTENSIGLDAMSVLTQEPSHTASSDGQRQNPSTTIASKEEDKKDFRRICEACSSGSRGSSSAAASAEAVESMTVDEIVSPLFAALLCSFLSSSLLAIVVDSLWIPKNRLRKCV
jgi:hypothetical protein